MKKSPLIILFLTVLLDLIGFGIVLPLLPTYAKALVEPIYGASTPESWIMIGVITSIYSLMQFIFSPIWGRLSDRIGRRPVMLFSIFIASISYIVFAHATTLPMLIAARFLSGVGSANIAAAQAYITDVTDPKNRSKAMGMMGAAFGLGFIIGPMIGGMLKTYYGGLVAAALIGIDFLLALFFLGESNPHAEKLSSLFRRSGPAEKTGLATSFRQKSAAYGEKLHAAFSSKPVALLMIINFIYSLAVVVSMQMGAILLWNEYFRATEKQVGILFAYTGIITVIVQGGMLPKLSKAIGEQKLMVFGQIVSFLGVFFLPFIPPQALFSTGLVILLFYAIGTSLVNPLNISMISLYSYKQKQGQIMGFAQSVNALARIMGPSIGSMLYGRDPHVPFVLAGGLTIICTILSISLLKYEIEALEPSADNAG